MDLKMNDVAEMLNVSEATIGTWLEEGKIPAYRMDDEYRFDRLEIEDWVMNHKLDETHGSSPFSQLSIEVDSAKGRGSQKFCLYRAIHRGTVLIDVPGETKEELISNATALIVPPFELDPQVVTELLLDREALMPTGLANGVAVPHTRDQIFNRHYDVVAIAFPTEPIEYGALDKLAVHTLFFLFAGTNKRHLHLLAKLAHLASNEEALALLRTKPSKNELLEFIRGWEAHIPAPRE